MTDYFITFGYGHPGYPGYVRITATDAQAAREMMFATYGDQWMTLYDSEEEVHPNDRYERDHLITKKKGGAITT